MEPGCHIVASTRLYGGSLNQIGHSFRKMDWHASFVDTDDPANVAAAITDKTRCIFVESLANPGGVVSDLAALATIAHDAGVPLIVDNTLASPVLCRPIKTGADTPVHTPPPSLNGHGNSVGGRMGSSGHLSWGNK